MKILQVAPPLESVPPEKYGGLEEMLFYLINGLTKNNNVSLLASKDSKTSAKLMPIFSHGFHHLQENNSVEQPEDPKYATLFYDYSAYINYKKFDIIHNHFYGSYSYGKLMWAKAYKDNIPTVITMHNDLDKSRTGEVMYKEFTDLNYIFLSEAQRARHKDLKSLGVIHNAVDTHDFPFSDHIGDYYYWISGIKPKKGTNEAIQAALKANIKLILAGNLYQPDTDKYWNETIKPQIDNKSIIYVGEDNLEDKVSHYRKAKALLFPSHHPEGCPMVPLESLACGTPVIAFDNPVLYEIIEDGYNGFICKDVNGIVNAIKRVESMSKNEYLKMRHNCRQTVITKFSIEKMVSSYEDIYHKLISDWKTKK